MGWIRVTDRLPELPADSRDRAAGVQVLVACEDGRVVAARWAQPRFSRRPLPLAPRWERYDGAALLGAAVSQWMPFPPSPDSGTDIGANAQEVAIVYNQPVATSGLNGRRIASSAGFVQVHSPPV